MKYLEVLCQFRKEKQDMRLLLSALALFVCAFGSIAFAQQPHPLRQIGAEPFKGDHAVACKLHATAQSQARAEDCKAILTRLDDQEDKTCSDKPLLQDGTIWWMPFTDKDGTHRISLTKIAFGESVSKDDPKRMVRVCDGDEMVKPHACGNYARPVPVPRSAPAYTPVPSTQAPLLEYRAVQFATYVYDRGICYPAELMVDASGVAYVEVQRYPVSPRLPGILVPYNQSSPSDY